METNVIHAKGKARRMATSPPFSTLARRRLPLDGLPHWTVPLGYGSSKRSLPVIDWSSFDRHNDPESTCYCRCGTIFLSHAKYVLGDAAGLVSRRVCPGCAGSESLWKVSSSVEYVTIAADGRGDVGAAGEKAKE